MHEIIPFQGWLKHYVAEHDASMPLEPNGELLSCYNYILHPLWYSIESESLYVAPIFINQECVILELIGEWNDALHNDIMFLKTRFLDHYTTAGVNKIILICEQVFTFHGSDDCYYEELFDDVEDGWIVALGVRDHILDEWERIGIDMYINYSEQLDLYNWRTLKPQVLLKYIDDNMMKFLN